jgi:cytochrome o ubiquinol oxidase subunit IV
MSQAERERHAYYADKAPGDLGEAGGVWSYLVGLALATLLTVVSFLVARTTLVWEPSIPVALAVLAVAQMGIHLVFFIHITSGPDNVNNVMALAFGVLIVLLVIVGSLWIMTNMNTNMATMEQVMQVRH